MTRTQLIEAWTRARFHIIVAQFAPTVLLTVTVWMLAAGLGEAELLVRLAAAGVLLASGVLGAVAQITAANDGIAAAADLAAASDPAGTEVALGSAVVARIARSGWWMLIVKFVTPTIFVLIYIVLLLALFL